MSETKTDEAQQNGWTDAENVDVLPQQQLDADECQFLVALLTHQQVCALLTQPSDKHLAASIQAKLAQ